MNFSTFLIIVVVLLLFLSFAIEYFRRIINYYSIYWSIKDAYDNMLYARRSYYEARFIEEKNAQEIQKRSAQKLYYDSISILDNAELKNKVEELPDELKEEVLEILSTPHYKLFWILKRLAIITASLFI